MAIEKIGEAIRFVAGERLHFHTDPVCFQLVVFAAHRERLAAFQEAMEFRFNIRLITNLGYADGMEEARVLNRGLVGNDMPQFVGQHACQFILGARKANELSGDVNATSGNRKSIGGRQVGKIKTIL